MCEARIACCSLSSLAFRLSSSSLVCQQQIVSCGLLQCLLQCLVVCCSVCCSVLWSVAVWSTLSLYLVAFCPALQSVAVRCTVSRMICVTSVLMPIIRTLLRPHLYRTRSPFDTQTPLPLTFGASDRASVKRVSQQSRTYIRTHY